jgi:hypothetical protein
VAIKIFLVFTTSVVLSLLSAVTSLGPVILPFPRIWVTFQWNFYFKQTFKLITDF